eukprot:Unigene784_Nuclearia_a/m.2553 Unigene784_Nuclearia_a/g.2553  ORF Unigene784_Nuclearia_a/g.2553 Unigene784_Nuclearia_a/m.2553 type:complete len:242 (+) Unigene784_Nuclearia_a:85-810(+)
MGTCAKISRWGLIIFNSLFLAAGIAVLAAGIYFYVQASTYGIPRTFSVGAIVVAIFVIVIALVGLVAAIIINKIMLWIYFALLVMILAAEIAVAVVAYQYTSSLESFLGQEYRKLSETDRAALENGFNCCGFLNTTDFSTPNSTCCLAVNNYNSTNPAPKQDPPPQNTYDVYYCYYNSFNKDGYVQSCLDAYYSFYSLYIVYLQAGAGVLAGIEVFGLIFAIALAIQADEASKDIEMNDYS